MKFHRESRSPWVAEQSAAGFSPLLAHLNGGEHGSRVVLAQPAGPLGPVPASPHLNPCPPCLFRWEPISPMKRRTLSTDPSGPDREPGFHKKPFVTKRSQFSFSCEHTWSQCVPFLFSFGVKKNKPRRSSLGNKREPTIQIHNYRQITPVFHAYAAKSKLIRRLPCNLWNNRPHAK